MPLFDRHSNRTQAIIYYLIEILEHIWFNNEEADFLIEKINKRRE